MVKKELEVGRKDYISAVSSFESSNFKWATIQVYYAIFHVARALLYKYGYREESHSALKLAIKELYITCGKLPRAPLLFADWSLKRAIIPFTSSG